MAYTYGSGTLGDYTGYSHGVTGNFATADVGIVGDSITTGGRPELAARLSLVGKTLAADYWSSRPSTPAITSTLARPLLPRILVMATGTNDIFNPTVMPAQIARMTGADLASKGVEHLVWVDVHCCRTKVPVQTQVYDMRNTGLVNNYIHGALDEDHIVDWYRWLNYRGITYPPLYLADGVHPKPGSGYKFWADIIMRKITPLF